MIIQYNSTDFKIEMAIAGGEATNYPKSYGAYNQKAWGRTAEGTIGPLTQVAVRIYAILKPNGVMGKVNETGLSRLEKFVKHAIKLHGPVQFKRLVNFSNDIELPAAIAGLGEVLS